MPIDSAAARALNEQANDTVTAAREAGKTSIPIQTATLEQAHALYTQALAHDPTNAEIYYNRSGVSDLLGWHAQAKIDLDLAIKHAPEDMKGVLSKNRPRNAQQDAAIYHAKQASSTGRGH